MKTRKNNPVRIDGSQGEGGGQILRSALTLSMISGRPFEIEKIRAGRKKPGLMRQHLTAVKAAARISSGQIHGAEIGSTNLRFDPGGILGGHYEFAVGTAGSTMLILQTILLPLSLAGMPSQVILEGGTHNPMAPTFDFLERSFLPVISRMGADVAMTLERPGFFPAGGGRIIVQIQPAAGLRPITILERGSLVANRATVWISGIPDNIARREINIIRQRLPVRDEHIHIHQPDNSVGPGNVVLVDLEFENTTQVFTAFGEVGQSAEKVGSRVCDDVDRYLKSSAPVGDYLADQLLLPMALARSGAMRCTALTPHALTNMDVIKEFLDIDFMKEREERLSWKVQVVT